MGWKIGSALLSNDGQGLDVDRMQTWVEQMSVLIADGVSSVWSHLGQLLSV